MDGYTITEQRPCEWPIVYGYLRLANKNPARRAALSQVLRGYCRRHELKLMTVFTDYGKSVSPLPGITGLLDVLRLVDTYGVVTLSPSHLGNGDMRTTHEQQIARTGCRLLMVRKPRPVQRSAQPPRKAVS
jgi:hypothetical protein